jgi:hypothetical protein
MIGGDLPLLDKCCKDTREQFIKECVPLYNMIVSNKKLFIKENDKQYTIYYSSSATETYEINQINGKINKVDTVIDDDYFFDQQNFPINRVINIKSYEMPLYYLYINNDDIFNIFISSKNKSLTDIFRIDRISEKFVGMSLTFNIFNLSLFTHTFFDIFEIFCDYFSIKDDISKTIDEKIKRKKENDFSKFEAIIRMALDNLFKNSKEYIVSISDLALHKKNITSNPESYPTNEKIDCENEKKIKNGTSYDSIIQGLAASIKNLAELLYNFSKDICCDEYKYIFLMSILSYRLKNKLVVGGWGFSIKKITEQLNEKIIIGKIIKNTQIFDINYFPPIYEYKITTYKDKTYGNCMENTILQFFKILFWDKNKQVYDLSKIDIIKRQYIEKFRWFFENIKYERDKVFIDKWTEFIMFDETKPKYDFIRIDVELNATFDNLFIVCYELFNNNNNNIPNEKKLDFLQNIIEKINLSVKSINMKKTYGLDIVELITYNKIFKITLANGRHAFFNDATSDNVNNSYIILNNISSNNNIFNTLLTEKKIEFHKELLQYILLRIMFSPNNENEMQKRFFNNSIKNNLSIVKNTIEFIFSDYRKKFCNEYTDILMNKKFIKETQEIQEIFWYYGISCVSDKWINYILSIDSLSSWKKIMYRDTFWNKALFYIKSDDFWKEIAKKNDILNTWKNPIRGETTWHYAVSSIKSDEFWKEIVKSDDILDSWKDIKNDDGLTVWHFAVSNIKSEEFWKEIVKKDNILDLWKVNDTDGVSVWRSASSGIKSDEFWNELSKKDNILDSWENIRDYRGFTVWHFAVKNIKSEEFWKEIAKKDDILDSWSNQNNYSGYSVWYSAVKNIKSEEFWREIAKKDKMLDSWKNLKTDSDDSVLFYAIKNIKSKEFWKEISKNNNMLNSWKDLKNYHGVSFWNVMVNDITFDEFWKEIAKKIDELKLRDDKVIMQKILHYINQQGGNNKQKYYKYVTKCSRLFSF